MIGGKKKKKTSIDFFSLYRERNISKEENI